MSTPTNSQPKQARAAVFVDYDNLYRWLDRNLHRRHDPAVFITEMVQELRRYLHELNQTRTVIVNAYADFGALCDNGQDVQNALYLVGAEPRFVPTHLQSNAPEIQLCIDALDVLHNRPDIQSYVVLTGDRPYLPLVQQFKRFGHYSFVAALEVPDADVDRGEEIDVFLDARHLLDDELQRELPREAPREPLTRDEDVDHFPLESDLAYHTLAVIEEHFGQYDEVYLTPLLRKLSEVLGPEADPKALVSDLEDANAVWLEKRRGTPYDYTVLIVDENHPDVRTVQSDLYGRDAVVRFEPEVDEPSGEYLEDARVAYTNEDGAEPDGVERTGTSTSEDGYIDEYDFSEPPASVDRPRE